jgi:hypothetical protein
MDRRAAILQGQRLTEALLSRAISEVTALTKNPNSFAVARQLTLNSIAALWPHRALDDVLFLFSLYPSAGGENEP